MYEGQLEGLKHNYEGWRNVVTSATLPGQHQMMEGDLNGIGDPRPDLGETPMSTHGHGRRHFSEGNCQNNHSTTACQGPGGQLQ